MKYMIALLATASTIAIAPPSFAADTATVESKTVVKSDAEGNYKKDFVEEKKDAQGTATKTKVKAKVDVGSDGEVNKKVTTETSVDPKGLMNKKTTKVEEEVKVSKDETKKKHKKVVNGTTVEEETSVEEHDRSDVDNNRRNY